MRRRAAWLAAIVSTFVVACGGEASGIELTLRAGGDAAQAEVQYQTPDGDQSETVTLPWEFTTKANGDWSVVVEVRNLSLSGKVSCGIGGLRLPVTAEGEATATCRASSSDGTVETSSGSSGFVKVNGEPKVVRSLRYRATTGQPKAFALTGETAWTASGGTLLGHDAVTGEEFRTTEANGVNGAARAGEGAIVAVDNNNVGGNPDTMVLRAADGTERVVFSASRLSDTVFAGDSSAWVEWVLDDESRQVMHVALSDGAILGQRTGTAVLVAGGDERALLWDEAAKKLLLLDEAGVQIAEAPQTTEPVVVLTVNGFALRTVAGNSVSIALLNRDTLKSLGASKGALGLFPTLVAGEDGSLFAGGDTEAAGVDPASGAVTCTVQTGYQLLGVSAQYLWLYAGESAIVALNRSDLGC